MLQVHLRDRFGDPLRLCDVVLRWPAMRDCAIRAVARADVPQNHEGRGAVLPALTYIGAARLFTDRVEVELAHHVLEPQVVGSTWRPHLQPRRLPLRERLGTMTTHDLV